MNVYLTRNPDNFSLGNGVGGIALVAATEKEVARFAVLPGQRAWIEVGVAVAALTGFKLKRAVTALGTERTIAADGDFGDIVAAGGTIDVLDITSATPHQTTASNGFQMQLGPAPEWIVYATSAGAAVVTIVGTIA